ncbi:MAG TPA: phosphate/phosphite/phosphonate ABC transporter substrate-binding protein, partial [Enterococcus sp.]|nr:phosphate/phosphite/phosphonate ABC transporter substrate-binding protein [Enterococcus sp.]
FASSFPDNDLFKDLKVLYLTEGDIPNDAIAVQPSMDAELKEQIKEVFLNMADDEEGAEAMSLWGHQGYEEAADSAYDTIRDYTQRAAE